MMPLTSEWVDKAEGDWAMVNRELRARKMPNYDGVCFHAQQCAEKYLKARLQEANLSFPKTHDVLSLLDLLLPVEPAWRASLASADKLTEYGVRYRYPGVQATKTEARDARTLCALVRQTVRAALLLPAD